MQSATQANTPDESLGAFPPIGGKPLEDLYAKNHDLVFRAAYRVTGNAMDAEDVLQTVFMRLLRREQHGLTGDAGPYLHRAAVHAAVDLLRHKKRQRLTADVADLAEAVEDPKAPRPDAGPEREHLRQALRSAMGRLRPSAAEIFALRYFENLPNHEIAEHLDMTPTAVAVSLHRSRGRLRDELASLDARSLTEGQERGQ
ncbi:MAG: sigma-70 family RNA polymerase sigma factor [Acidobacteriota bacterium]